MAPPTHRTYLVPPQQAMVLTTTYGSSTAGSGPGAVGSGTVPSSSSLGWVRAGGSRGCPFPPTVSTIVPHPTEDPSRVESSVIVRWYSTKKA
ncbi:unnamed protein product [Miscanthus lutarioriparius]|uniref:Uncharacterized protein n=1 Tax=Miscanthus lutarioriparius TaxID=422564 RepID=A0A811MAC4_9POAL|nr:unnamed protein product [Miscanthus lutarioriparius]